MKIKPFWENVEFKKQMGECVPSDKTDINLKTQKIILGMHVHRGKNSKCKSGKVI